MTPGAWLQVGAILAAIIALVGSIYTARSARAANKETNTAAPYPALAERVVALEKADSEKGKRIAALERRESRLIGYVRDMWAWISRGSVPPPPSVPVELHDVLPPHEWDFRPTALKEDQ